ncbi:cohesin subunit SA-2 isoform X3 [Bemisia tabaci]|uniref:cohesin subunit SA-2 isoform X3 n=1 Tax=Bemisia tabaci TaxID=7038 RepID=UPI003B28BF87
MKSVLQVLFPNPMQIARTVNTVAACNDYPSSDSTARSSDLVMEQGIYADLVKGSCRVSTLANNWRDSHSTDPQRCRKSFYELMFCCARIAFNNTVSETLSSFQSELPAAEKNCPILNRHFCARLEIFLILCFKDIPIELLQDTNFWDTVTIIVNKLMERHETCCRHASTIFGLKIMDAMMVAHNELGNPELEGDDEDQEAIPPGWTALRIFQTMLKAYFHYAYKDVAFGIKMKALSALKKWMSEYPEIILQPLYFRYISWSAYAQSKKIRILCLEMSKTIFERSESEDIQAFAEREIPVLNWQLTVESPDEICLATECLILIFKNYPSVAEEIRLNDLYSNIFHKNKAVAQATAEFILETIRKNNSPETTVISLARFAEKVLISDPLLPETCLSDHELIESLRIFVNSFSEISEEIFDVDALVGIFKRNNETPSFKRFTASFLKAITHEANEPTSFRSSGKDNKDEENNNRNFAVKVTDELLKCLGFIISSHREDKIFFEKMLSICQCFHDDLPFNNEDLENLLMKIIHLFSNSTEPSVNENCVKALHTLSKKCTKEENRIAFNAKTNALIDSLVLEFEKLLESWESQLSTGSAAYYEELTSIQRKLFYLHPYFKIPLTTFRGCEIFVTYFCQIFNSGPKILNEITIWQEVIELCLEMMVNHVKYAIEEEDNEDIMKHCVAVCFQYFPTCMRYRCTSNPSVYFVSSFTSSFRIMKLLSEKKLLEELVDQETRKNMDLSLLHFIKKHMVPFQDDTTTNMMAVLWAEFSECLLIPGLVSSRMLFGLLDFSVYNKNPAFQQALLSTLAVLFNQKEKPEIFFECLLRFLLTIFKRSTSLKLLDNAKAVFAELAKKVAKDDIQISLGFYYFHIDAVDRIINGNIPPQFLRCLKITLCFLDFKASDNLIS